MASQAKELRISFSLSFFIVPRRRLGQERLRKMKKRVHFKTFVESARTKPRRSMIAICALASIILLRCFTMSSRCCVFTDCGLYIIKILNKRFYSNIRPILFEFRDFQFTQYNMELRYILLYWQRPERQRLSHRPRATILDNSWAENANLWHVLNDALSNIKSDHWWLDQKVKKLIAFRSRKFIACHLKPSFLNNAGILWCAKKHSRMQVLMKG